MVSQGHVRNDNTRERMKVENVTERCRKARLEETRTRIHWKTNTGDGTKRKTRAEMGGLCVNRYMTVIGTTKDEVHASTLTLPMRSSYMRDPTLHQSDASLTSRHTWLTSEQTHHINYFNHLWVC